MREFKALRRMDRHQLHGIVGHLLIEADVAVEFVEVTEIFDEIAKPLVLRFSLSHSPTNATKRSRYWRSASDGRGASSKRLDQFIQQLCCGFPSRGMPQRMHQFNQLRRGAFRLASG